MAIELKTLQSDRRRVIQVPVANDDGEVEMIGLAIWHKPLTPELVAQIDAIETTDKERLITQLAIILTRWDITDGGKPVKPSEKILRSFDYEFLAAISEAIFEPLYPKSTT